MESENPTEKKERDMTENDWRMRRRGWRERRVGYHESSEVEGEVNSGLIRGPYEPEYDL